MGKENWIWMPHAGHLCVGHDCRFHLATYVNGYIVSTVGEYWPDIEIRRSMAETEMRFHPEKKIDLTLRGDYFDHEYMKVFGFVDIGLNRTYETMVFKAKKRDDEYQCCMWKVTGDCLDMEGYGNPSDAYEGHMELCEKWEEEGKSWKYEPESE